MAAAVLCLAGTASAALRCCARFCGPVSEPARTASGLAPDRSAFGRIRAELPHRGLLPVLFYSSDLYAVGRRAGHFLCGTDHTKPVVGAFIGRGSGLAALPCDRGGFRRRADHGWSSRRNLWLAGL